MDLNDLQTFVAVAEAGTFSGAARRLGVPKSTVSRRVARLEAALDTALLVRATRSFVLSDDGRALFERCGPALQDIADVTRDLVDSQAAPRGELRVSASIDLGTTAFLTGLLAAYGEAHRQVRVDLLVTNRVVNLLEEGVDVAFRTHTGQLPSRDDLVVRALSPVVFGAYASPAYLARHGTPTAVAALADHRRVGHSTARIGPWTDPPPLTANDFRPLAALLAGHAGIGALPDFVAAPFVEAGALVRVIPEWAHPPATLSLVWLRNRHLAPRVRAFIDLTIARAKGTDWFR